MSWTAAYFGDEGGPLPGHPQPPKKEATKVDTGYLVYLQYRLEKMGQEIIKEELAGNHQEAQFLKDDYEMLQQRIKDIETAQ